MHRSKSKYFVKITAGDGRINLTDKHTAFSQKVKTYPTRLGGIPKDNGTNVVQVSAAPLKSRESKEISALWQLRQTSLSNC